MKENYWKIGCNWDGTDLLNMFIKFGCLFYGGVSADNAGDYTSVKANDFILVCEGSTPVALARAASGFSLYRDSDVRLPETVEEALEWFDADAVAICPADVIVLPQKQRRDFAGSDTRRRFCGLYNPELQQSIREAWCAAESMGIIKN